MLPFTACPNVCEPHRFMGTVKSHPRTHAPNLQVQDFPGERSPWQHPNPSPAGRGWAAPCQGIRAHLPGLCEPLIAFSCASGQVGHPARPAPYLGQHASRRWSAPRTPISLGLVLPPGLGSLGPGGWGPRLWGVGTGEGKGSGGPRKVQQVLCWGAAGVISTGGRGPGPRLGEESQEP